MNRRYIVGAAAAVLLATAPCTIGAAPLAPSKPSETVTAFISSDGSACPDNNSFHVASSFRLNADGTQTPFAIPPKSVFVVTSYDYSVSGATAGRYAGLGVFGSAPGS